MVTVYDIVPGLNELNSKEKEIDNRLLLMCMERNIPFLSHNLNIDMSQYLTESKLRLNNHCTKAFTKDFFRHLVKLK